MLKGVDEAGDMILLNIDMKATPDISFTGAQSDKAKDYPLAKSCAMFNAISLTFRWALFQPHPRSMGDCHKQLLHLFAASELRADLARINEAAKEEEDRVNEEAQRRHREIEEEREAKVREIRERRRIMEEEIGRS